ncbi:MAG: DUF3099 domain-containing protein [Nocardioidaceae bacterium]
MSSHQDSRVTITSARSGHSADIRRREIRYLFSMGVRTLCFIAAILTQGPIRWVLVAAALVLPYIAVVVANASERRNEVPLRPYVAEAKPQIDSADTATSDAHDTPPRTTGE